MKQISMSLNDKARFKAPSNFILQQDSHVAWGLALTFMAVVLNYPWWYGSAAILIIALVKELTYDQIVEHQPFFWGSMTDLAVYAVGCFLGALVVLYL